MPCCIPRPASSFVHSGFRNQESAFILTARQLVQFGSHFTLREIAKILHRLTILKFGVAYRKQPKYFRIVLHFGNRVLMLGI